MTLPLIHALRSARLRQRDVVTAAVRDGRGDFGTWCGSSPKWITRVFAGIGWSGGGHRRERLARFAATVFKIPCYT